MGDRPVIFSRVRMSEDKVCRKDMRWYVRVRTSEDKVRRKDMCWSVRVVYVLENCQM